MQITQTALPSKTSAKIQVVLVLLKITKKNIKRSFKLDTNKTPHSSDILIQTVK